MSCRFSILYSLLAVVSYVTTENVMEAMEGRLSRISYWKALSLGNTMGACFPATSKSIEAEGKTLTN